MRERTRRSPRLPAAAALCTAILLITLIGPTPADAAIRAEHRMFRLVNRDRHSHGVFALRRSASASRLARRHSRKMAREHQYFDSACLDCIRRNHGWTWIGENAGYATTVRAMNRWFMHSPPHRANILSTHFTRVGIGIVRAGRYVWVTEIFYRP
jgi:uncharacterized protein YkwD